MRLQKKSNESPHGILNMTLSEGWKVDRKMLEESGILVGKLHAVILISCTAWLRFGCLGVPRGAYVSLLLSLKYLAMQCTQVGPTD